MYFPILRGRQFELLALRECADKNLIGDHVVPIVEPVKLSPTFIKTVDTFIEKGKKIAIIKNPQVGAWQSDVQKESNAELLEKAHRQLENTNVITSFYMNSEFDGNSEFLVNAGENIDEMIFICNDSDFLEGYETITKNKKPLYTLLPDKAEFRRKIRNGRVMCEDHFKKRQRNVDYIDVDNEPFSSDHLYYKEDGYIGFSDYTVIGEEYNEMGFAPYAVAIHIVYFDDEKKLRVAHFVSDSNEDIYDPARKFAEAAEKLVDWNKKMKLMTVGIQEIEAAYANKIYSGLGVVKKYSIMHHLELMSKYLDEVAR